VKRNGYVRTKLSALLTNAVLTVALILPMGSAAAYTVTHHGNQPITKKTGYPHVPGRILIEFKQSPAESFWEALGSRYGLAREKRLDTFRSLREIAQEVRTASGAKVSLGESCYTATLPNTDDAFMDVVLADLESQQELILNAQPDYIYEACQSSGSNVQPNDPLFSSLIHGLVRGGWALEWAHFPGAWRWGTSGATIAILDGRADTNHPDLRVDPRSQDFVQDGDFSVSDHGTSVAGIAGAVGNNSVGSTGGTWNASLVCERVVNSTNLVSTSVALASLNHLATLPDVRVVNMSWGGPAAGDSLLHDSIRAMRARGVVFVASAGNDGNNIDTQPFYPAAWPEVIPVAMSGYQQNTLDPRSNWGRNCIAAPGGGFILTTKPGGGYDFFSGTSAAAPFVSAAASLLFSQGYSADEVEWRLRNGVDKPASLSQVAGALNVEASFLLTAPALSAAFSQASYTGSEGDSVGISVGVSNATARTFIEFGDGTTASITGSFNGSHVYPYGQFVAKATVTAGASSITVTSMVTITDKLEYKIKLKSNGKAKVSATSSRFDAVLTLTINGMVVIPDEPGYWVAKKVARPATFVIISSKGARVVVNK
jgi:hypothetical protein